MQIEFQLVWDQPGVGNNIVKNTDWYSFFMESKSCILPSSTDLVEAKSFFKKLKNL